MVEQTGGERDLRADWERLVWQRSGNRCGNCGADGDDARLRVRMIVPPRVGGKRVDGNGVVLCRACEMAWDSQGTKPTEDKRPVNLWVSAALHGRLQEGLSRRNGFASMSALVRYLVGKYVLDESRFDDLESYQDEGSDVKINLWLQSTDYNLFKSMVDRRGMTVTAAIKGLILMYADQTALLGELE